MRTIVLAAAVWIGCGIATRPWAAEPSDMDGAKTPAGAVVAAYLAKEWGPDKDPAGAAKLLSPHLIEHGYLGMAGVRPPPGARPAPMPGKGPVITPRKIIAQGDLVFVQGIGRMGTKGNGDLMWILYRVDDGLITEHWDTHNPIPDDQVGKQF